MATSCMLSQVVSISRIPIEVNRTRAPKNSKRFPELSHPSTPQGLFKVIASGESQTPTLDRAQDHYKRLGVTRDASTAQIVSAFEQKCKDLAARRGLQSESAAVINDLEGVMISKSRGAQTLDQQLHPELPESTKQLLNSVLTGTLESYLDKSFGSNPPSTEPLSEAGQTAITSTESFDVLASEETRRYYDWTVMRDNQPPGTYIWPFEADPSQRVINGTPPRPNVESDPEGTDKVAVFIIASLIVSIILNLYLGK